MSKRSDNIGFKVMPSGNIRAFRTDKADKRGVSELMITFGGGHFANHPHCARSNVLHNKTDRMTATGGVRMQRLLQSGKITSIMGGGNSRPIQPGGNPKNVPHGDNKN